MTVRYSRAKFEARRKLKDLICVLMCDCVCVCVRANACACVCTCARVSVCVSKCKCPDSENANLRVLVRKFANNVELNRIEHFFTTFTLKLSFLKL